MRPEHFLVEDVGPSIIGRVAIVENLGEVVIAHLDIGAQTPLVAKLPGTVRLRKGENVSLRFDPAALHFFDSDGRALPDNSQAL
jgi:ABC-type sugar transport system ATPase subunit